MYIFRNAMANIRRSKGRSILFGVIVFIIAISACLALSIRAAAETTRAEGLKNLSITGNITLDMDEIMQGEGGQPPSKSDMRKGFQNSDLSLTELEKYSELSSVKSFYYTGSTSANASKIEAVSSSDSMGGGRMGGPGMNQESSGDFTITGYSSDEAMTQFANGNAEITDGKLFTEGTEDLTCVISSSLATYNSLKVGDTIKFTNPSDTSKTFKVKVVGIYKQTNSSSSDQQGQGGGMMMGNSNNIYMSYAALEKISKSAGLDMATRGSYTFASYEDYQKFESQAHKAGLDSKYTVESMDVNNYERQLQPLENLSTYAKYFLIIMLVIGGAVLLILTMFSIRERKYEIGVLAAIGMNKKKISRQFIYEIAAISMVAIMLGGVIGSLSSVPVTNKLLASSVSSTQSESFDRGGPGQGQPDGMPDGPQDQQDQDDQSSSDSTEVQATSATTTTALTTTNTALATTDSSDTTTADRGDGDRMGRPGMQDYVDSVTSAANMKVTLEMILVGLALIAVSGTAAMSGVMKYDPLQILTTRD